METIILAAKVVFIAGVVWFIVSKVGTPEQGDPPYVEDDIQ